MEGRIGFPFGSGGGGIGCTPGRVYAPESPRWIYLGVHVGLAGVDILSDTELVGILFKIWRFVALANPSNRVLGCIGVA